MPGVEPLPLAEKPAEMSFSDWKKMKSALNSSIEMKFSNKPEIRKNPGNARASQVNQSTFNRQNKNSNKNINDRGNNIEYRQQPRQNSLHFNSLDGILETQMRMMQSFNFMARNINMRSYDNNMVTFDNNMVPFYNSRGSIHNNTGPPYNNMWPQYNGAMNLLNNSMFKIPLRVPPLMSDRSFRPEKRNLHSNLGFTDNYIGKNNDFEYMPDFPIPQQPYKQDKNSQPHMSTNTQQRNVIGNRKKFTNKFNDTKPNATTMEIGADNETAAEATSTVTQKKPKPQKHKRDWIPFKPPMPPPLIALTPEAQAAKQKMWREYRQKIKPFKNKDFLNAKRVIQRLKKKPYEDLDEKDKERWQKANEFVNSHKKMLTEKAMARGEAASARAARVQEAFYSEMNFAQSSKSAATSLPLKHNVSFSNNYGEQRQSKNSNDMPSTSGAIGTSNSNEDWEVWSSFVPSGVLFNS